MKNGFLPSPLNTYLFNAHTFSNVHNVSARNCVPQSLSLSKTLFNHPWSVFHLFIDDFDQDLFVRFELVRGFNPTNPYFVDPWPGLHEIRFVRDCNVLHTNFPWK